MSKLKNQAFVERPIPRDDRIHRAIALAKLAHECNESGSSIILDLLDHRAAMDRICDGLRPFGIILTAYDETDVRILLAKCMKNGNRLSLGHVTVLAAITSSHERQRILRITLSS
jgi:hypothetical protein